MHNNPCPQAEAEVEAWLSLGSNMPDASGMIADAKGLLSSSMNLIDMCEPYATDPVGGVGPRYINTVAFVRTSLSRSRLTEICKNIEAQMGRTDESRKRGEVPIDIDVVIYDGHICRRTDFDHDYFRHGYMLMRENYQS